MTSLVLNNWALWCEQKAVALLDLDQKLYKKYFDAKGNSLMLLGRHFCQKYFPFVHLHLFEAFSIGLVYFIHVKM